MIYRTTDPAIIAQAVKGHAGDDFIPEEWVADDKNIALVNLGGDVNLFQFQADGVYIGHFFYVSRGREALRVARDMLARIMTYDEVKVIIGLTPVEKLGAKWLTRKLGFKSYGEVDTVPGRCEMFVLSRMEYEKDLA